jgi:hypothetical protein
MYVPMSVQQNAQRDAITQALMNVQSPPPRPQMPQVQQMTPGAPGIGTQMPQPGPTPMVGGGAVPSSMPNPQGAPPAPASAPGLAPQLPQQPMVQPPQQPMG